MEQFLGDSELTMYLEALDIVANDARVLFRLLDRDQSGIIDIDEFCDGCMRLKGEAKSFDVHCMIYESTRLMNRWADFMDFSEERLNNIDGFVQRANRAARPKRKDEAQKGWKEPKDKECKAPATSSADRQK